MNFRAEPLADLVFQVRDVRIGGERSLGAVPALAPSRVCSFAIKPSVCRTLRASLMTRSAAWRCWFSSVEAENDLGVTDREPAFANETLHVGRKFEQAQRVGDDGAALADLGGDEFLRELKLADELRVAERFFDGIEIFALEIFDERHLQHRAVIRLADEDGDFGQAGESEPRASGVRRRSVQNCCPAAGR